MRLLFLSHYFPPEVNAPANRTFEHARIWAREGHEVHVVTGFPSHPRGVLFPGWERRWHRHEVVEGVHVHRVWTYLAPNAGVVRRTLNYLSFVPTSVWRALRLGRFDVILATSPQFFNAVAGYLSAVLKRTPWVFELRDLWPESIVAVGAVRPSLAIRLLERLELRMYRHASRVVCVTKAFVRTLVERGVPAARLAYVPNGIEPEAWEGAERAEAWRERLGAGPEDVAVTYVGTVGMAHGLGMVLDAAERLRDEPRIRFAVVGEGAERERLQREARVRGLESVKFAGMVPRADVPSVLAASDVSLVLLRDAPTFRTVLPSKMFEAMAAAKPVVLGVDGQAREVLEASGGGVFVPPGDAGRLADVLRELAHDAGRRSALGRAGRAFVAREFDRDAWARRFTRLLATVRASGPSHGG